MEDSKSTPLVSVVIPMFNAYPFIGEMLECMEKQTYSNWELIIVDDGSTDESVETVEKFAEKDSRIRLIKRPDNRKKGGNTCRNIGLENAQGEYIIWFDADDLITTYCLKQRVDFINSHPKIDFAIFPAIAFREKIGDTYMITGVKRTSNDYHHFLKNFVPFQVVTNIYHRKSLLSNGIRWDEDLYGRQDPDFNIFNIKNNLSYEYSHLKPDYFWRISGNNQSVSKQILTPKKLETNIYYLNKRINEDLNNMTKSSISYLAFFLLKPLLEHRDWNGIEQILNTDIYKGLSKYRKCLISYIFRSKNSFNIRIINKILIFLNFPIRSIRQILYTKHWSFTLKILAFSYMKDLRRTYSH